ncbi:MAG: GNAT family N-acetyltransferase [Tistlia sp.]|uniref:GNAT family N-acetyltransferase n=1 Tax=Tistlia sp. TaxID=3057121 RepID=UPI0034A1D0B3
MEQIRQAGPEDLAAIEALVEAAYAVYVPRMGRRPGPMDDDYAARIAAGQAWVVPGPEGAPLALLVLEPQPDFLLVDNLAVAAAGRGQGLARRLLAFAESEARRLGYQELQLYTHKSMTENLAIYRHLGWELYRWASEKGFERAYFRKSVA